MPSTQANSKNIYANTCYYRVPGFPAKNSQHVYLAAVSDANIQQIIAYLIILCQSSSKPIQALGDKDSMNNIEHIGIT